MSDILDFYDNFDEFAEMYSFKDSDEVYTNGIELIPVFRVKQWLEHIEDNGTPLTESDDCVSRANLMEMIELMTDIKGNTVYVVRDSDIRKMPSVQPKRDKGEWIPVSERLPQPFSYVNCTCHSLIDAREDWVVETCYVPQPKGSPYSDWGNIFMLNHGECKVVAWMYRDIPEPYKAESEDKE